MKLVSNKKVDIRGTVIGGDKMLFCTSLRSGDKRSLLADAREAMKVDPDIIEWRIDHFNPVVDADFVKVLITGTLKELREIIGAKPLLLCFRIVPEGGIKWFSKELMYSMLKMCVETGYIDLVDIEIDGEAAYTAKVIKLLRDNDVKIILSHHDYNETPSVEQIIARIQLAQTMGADIAKYLYTASQPQDSVRIALAGKKAKEENLVDIPYCLYAMNDSGFITRMLGCRAGNDYCYFSMVGAKGGKEEDAVYYYELKKLLNIE